MLKLESFVQPRDIAEAYALLHEREDNLLLAGCTLSKMGQKQGHTGIDLSVLGLDGIERKEDGFHIGAMVDLRALEAVPAFAQPPYSILGQAVAHFGTQLKQAITVGGTVAAKFGPSDLLTALLALDAKVVCYQSGVVPLDDFLKSPQKRDIITAVMVPLHTGKAAMQQVRNEYADFAVLNAAVCRDGQGWRVSVGGRPGVAALCPQAMQALAQGGSAEQAAALAAAELNFGSNMRASAVYRKTVCPVLVRRAIEEVQA